MGIERGQVEQIIVGIGATALGHFGAVLSSSGLAYLTFASEPQVSCALWIARRMPQAQVINDSMQLAQLSAELDAYCSGDLQTFTLPLDLRGTPFQIRVWQALQQIPYGTLQTYRQIAIKIGHPQASRAVGAANGANPVAILVPCHRLAASTGKLINYSGGLLMKQQLLQIEGVLRSDCEPYSGGQTS